LEGRGRKRERRIGEMNDGREVRRGETEFQVVRRIRGWEELLVKSLSWL
jgi:hypothetical protein